MIIQSLFGEMTVDQLRMAFAGLFALISFVAGGGIVLAPSNKFALCALASISALLALVFFFQTEHWTGSVLQERFVQIIG